METKKEMTKLQTEQINLIGTVTYYDCEKWLRKHGYKIEIDAWENKNKNSLEYAIRARHKMGKIEIYDTKKYLSFGLLIENLENEIFEITILAHHAIEEYNENQRINGGDIVEYIHVAKI